MTRRLTRNQQVAYEYVADHGSATIKEVAESTVLTYQAAQQALFRLADRGLVWKDRIEGNRMVVYTMPRLESPDSPDPLEQAFCLPDAEVDH